MKPRSPRGFICSQTEGALHSGGRARACGPGGGGIVQGGICGRADLKRFDHFAVGVTQGTLDLFAAFEDGGPMWTGEGKRRERRHVRFDESFVAPPVVHVALSMWDIGANANQRADIRARKVTCDGFEIEFRTWGDTRVARVRASWLAIGPVPHIDDFDAG